VIRAEEESFGRTLDRGLKRFGEAAASGTVSREAAFELYDTYGFPLDMTQLLAAERGRGRRRGRVRGADGPQRERGRAAQKRR
jgi:alanyl-tRNA synthetase